MPCVYWSFMISWLNDLDSSSFYSMSWRYYTILAPKSWNSCLCSLYSASIASLSSSMYANYSAREMTVDFVDWTKLAVISSILCISGCCSDLLIAFMICWVSEALAASSSVSLCNDVSPSEFVYIMLWYSFKITVSIRFFRVTGSIACPRPWPLLSFFDKRWFWC